MPISYAHLVPELRALGTALLAGVSVVSVVLGLAAQSTLGNLVAGLSLVLYRPIRVGDKVQVNSPKGLTTATVELVSLGYTLLRDTEKHEVIVPNSVMVSSVVIGSEEQGCRPIQLLADKRLRLTALDAAAGALTGRRARVLGG